ncbi:hypothetical protein LCI18_012692 [Fusarium solani-melongenae]|uniref:Uncharacterized protein n=1 Tax=Fusarium solani subsp. cucurbitae TaxID=2747967 RepID=A0ACD3ZLD5_FUSSC|nr:hypothetical protein LCI18_012692 [Fusarium solani-melongenae]
MPIHHVTLATGRLNFKRMCNFYTLVLKPLGYSLTYDTDHTVGYTSKNGASDFGLHAGPESSDTPDPSVARIGAKTHVAFQADSREAVQDWYEVAIKAGGISNGEPGERIEYAKGYYAAFIIDPLGNNIEAVCFE